MNFDPIVLAMVSAIVVFDEASPSEMDPDLAVRGQEIVGSYLSELSPEDAAEFRQILSRLADERSPDDPALAGYLKQLADGLARQ